MTLKPSSPTQCHVHEVPASSWHRYILFDTAMYCGQAELPSSDIPPTIPSDGDRVDEQSTHCCNQINQQCIQPLRINRKSVMEGDNTQIIAIGVQISKSIINVTVHWAVKSAWGSRRQMKAPGME